MKYCTNCGAKMEDEALFCSKCGTKAAPIIEEKKESYEEDQVVEETPKKPNKAVKGPAKPLHEEKLKEFLPVSLVVIAATILLWIIQNLVHPTDILRVMPLIIFTIIGGFYGILNLLRAKQCYKRQIYFKAALSLVLAVVLFTCTIIDLITLIGG